MTNAIVDISYLRIRNVKLNNFTGNCHETMLATSLVAKFPGASFFYTVVVIFPSERWRCSKQIYNGLRGNLFSAQES